MKQAKFISQFEEKNMQFEHVDENPCKSFVPKQAVKLSELVARFDRGQRLNVGVTRPSNLVPEDTPDETFDDCLPSGIDDIVDVERFQSELNERKRNLKKKVDEKKKALEEKEAKEAKEAQPIEPKE